MPACEKCWNDSRRAEELHGDRMAYQKLLRQREAEGHVCTPEEQAGEDATHCTTCNRRTVHQYAGRCMVCGILAMHDETMDALNKSGEG